MVCAPELRVQVCDQALGSAWQVDFVTLLIDSSSTTDPDSVLLTRGPRGGRRTRRIQSVRQCAATLTDAGTGGASTAQSVRQCAATLTDAGTGASSATQSVRQCAATLTDAGTGAASATQSVRQCAAAGV